MENKGLEAVKLVRKQEKENWEKAIFCKEHNMKLDEMKHREIEGTLRKLAQRLEDIFETGYVSVGE